MKRSIKLLMFACIYLLVCFGIGQYRNLKKGNIDHIPNTETENHAENTENHFMKITFEGVQEIQDTPWNFNAGMINMEGEGECAFLTPNTGMVLVNIAGMSMMHFSTQIHPWVREASDGAGLLIWVLDADGNILQEQTETVDTQDTWETFTISIAEPEKAESIKIFCNNGGNDDDNGDWVVIKYREN